MTGRCGSPGEQQGRYRPWNSLGDTGLDRGRFPQGPRARPRYRRLSRKSLQGLGVLYANTNGRGAITLTLLAHIRDPGRPDEKEKKREKNHQTKRNARSGREGVVHEWNRERSLTTDRLSGCRVRPLPKGLFLSAQEWCGIVPPPLTVQRWYGMAIAIWRMPSTEQKHAGPGTPGTARRKLRHRACSLAIQV